MLAPADELNQLVTYYWELGYPDTKIVDHVLDHFDNTQYGFR